MNIYANSYFSKYNWKTETWITSYFIYKILQKLLYFGYFIYFYIFRGFFVFLHLQIIEICIILCARLDYPRNSDDTYVSMNVWKYVCAQRLEKQVNATVLLVVWYRRWWDKQSAETRPHVYQRRSCKSFIK